MSAHDTYVFAAYAASLIVIGILVVWIFAGDRARKAELAELEEAGIKRRSEKS
mgnify:CR=1 FL=1|jgi:heme exporter protein D